MQVQLSFLEEKTAAGAAPVWSTLDDEQRAEVVTTLARVIAKSVAAEHCTALANEKENGDE